MKKSQFGKFFTMFLMVLMLSFTFAVPAFAGQPTTSSVDLNWVTQTPQNDIFGNVTTTIEEVGQSGYRLVFRVAQIAAVVVMAVIGVTFMITKDKTSLKESKGWLGHLLVGVIIVFAGSIILELVIGIASNLSVGS